MKRIIIVTVILVLIGFGVWKFMQPSQHTKVESVKITVLGENSATIQAMTDLKKQYELSHPGIELDFKAKSFDDAFTSSNQDFANKTGLYDVVMQYNFSLASFVRNDYVYTIDELAKYVPKDSLAFEKNLYVNNWREVGYYYKDDTRPEQGEEKVAYPFSAHSMLLMYNKEMFEDVANQKAYLDKYRQPLKVPQTWEDFYKVSQFFTDPAKKTYGVCVGGAGGGFLYYDFMNFIYSMGGRVLDKTVGWHGDATTKVVLNSPESLKALKYYISLKQYNAGNFSTIDQYETMRQMKSNKTAMSIVWSDLLYPGTKTANGFDQRFGYASIPGDKAIFVGGAYFISKFSKHPKETFEYITWLKQENTQVELAKRGLCPASSITFENPEVKALPYASALQQSLSKGGVILEAGPDANMISEVITNYVQKAWSGELSPKNALAQAHNEIVIKRKEIFSKIVK
jgi:ABC-type glycerol-3-phosphate transport system substrate-binding protein